jgi:4-hydroxy-tetrahydrodipicolinate reductase
VVAVRVVVAGATGKTGSEAAKAIHAAPDLQLVAAVARARVGEDLGVLLEGTPWQVQLSDDMEGVLRASAADVLVDFTLGESAGRHATAALRAGVRPIVGATGLPKEAIQEIHDLARERQLGAMLIPNFSFGVLLLQRFCREALRFFPDVEVVELHHDQKRDRPSGTARQLQSVLEANGAHAPVPVHSVRLPGLVAHHEVLFGGPGETMTVRHDTLSRASFGPGIVLAVRKAPMLRGQVIEGLEGLLEID